MQSQHPFVVTGTNYTLRTTLPLCRRTLGSERHRYTIAWPHKLGTDSMAYGGSNNKWTPPPRKMGVILWVRPPDSAWVVWRMSRLTRDGTAEPVVSRDQIIRRERGQEKISWGAGLATLLPSWSILCCYFVVSQEKSERAQTFWTSPSQGEKMSKRLGGIIGCEYKTSSWHLNGFPDDGSNIGSTV